MGFLERLIPINTKDMNFGEWKAEIPADSETNKDRPVLLFFGGSSMEAHSNAPITESLYKTLAEVHGKGPDMAAFASMLSSQATWATRFEDMAAQLETVAGSERPTYIVVYSLGAAEFLKAFLHMLKNRAEKSDKNGEKFQALDLSNIHLIIRSPAGAITSGRDNLRQGKQLAEMMQATMMDKPSAHLEYALTYPPKHDGVPRLNALLPALYQAYPSLAGSQKEHPTAQKLETHNTQEKDYLSQILAPELQTELARLDKALLDSLGDIRSNPEIFKQALEARTTFLKKHAPLEKILGSNTLHGKSWEVPRKRALSALLGFVPLVGRAMAGNNAEIYKFLKSRGMKFGYISPVSEKFTPIDNVTAFFSAIDDDMQIVEMPGTHITYTNRPDDAAAAVRQLITPPPETSSQEKETQKAEQEGWTTKQVALTKISIDDNNKAWIHFDPLDEPVNLGDTFDPDSDVFSFIRKDYERALRKDNKKTLILPPKRAFAHFAEGVSPNGRKYSRLIGISEKMTNN